MSTMHRKEFLSPEVEAMTKAIEEVFASRRWSLFPFSRHSRRLGFAGLSAHAAEHSLRRIKWDERQDDDSDDGPDSSGVPVR